MKKFVGFIYCVAVVAFIACGEKGQDNAEVSKALKLHNDFVEQNTSEEIVALQQRASASGYKLISATELNNQKDAIIIATLPRGIYNLGLIDGAKHFEFARSIAFNDDGSEWNWEKDSLGREQKEFLAFLGEDKNKMIVFYDEGEDVFAPFGSTHTALIWARHLGYTNLYRLVGGFGAWKDLGLPVSTQKPQCCENPHTGDSNTHHSHDGHHNHGEHNHSEHHEHHLDKHNKDSSMNEHKH